MEEMFVEIAALVATLIEAAAILIVIFGSAMALAGCILAAARSATMIDQRRTVYLRYAAWILLALEFALAADIVRTMVAPTWDDIGKLAAIAAIRTVLNYFLERDIKEFGEPRAEAA